MIKSDCFSLVVSEDVVEEVAVDARVEVVQLLLLQQRGPISPVHLCTALSRLGGK